VDNPLVASVYRMHGTAAMSLPEDTSLEEVIRTLAENPTLRAVFLVNAEKRYTLMITRGDLLNWAHLNLSGGKGSNMAISEIFRILDARKAKDLASPFSSSLALKEQDTLQRALSMMMEFEEDILPVLDNQGKITGDLRLSELLYWVFTYGHQREK